jgi:hypothetical protein
MVDFNGFYLSNDGGFTLLFLKTSGLTFFWGNDSESSLFLKGTYFSIFFGDDHNLTYQQEKYYSQRCLKIGQATLSGKITNIHWGLGMIF